MFGHMTKIIRADKPIEHLVQIQPKLKCFLLQILNSQQNNSKFSFVNSVTDNNCDKNILLYVNKNSLKIWKTQKHGHLFIYIYVDVYPTHYLFIYIYVDLYPAHYLFIST